jgi:hypothetical protein
MRGTAILLGTCFTLVYGYVAQAAMSADRAEVMRRLAAAGESRGPVSLTPPVWNGGTLAPITVVATAGPASERASVEAARPRSGTPPAGARRPQPPSRSGHTVRIASVSRPPRPAGGVALEPRET